MNIGLLCSGGLGLGILEKLIDWERQVIVVFTDKGSDQIIEKCKDLDIPLFIGNPRKGDAAIFLSSFKIDLLLSVNYLFLVKKDVYGQAGIAVNFHGSLLPKYRGRTPHVWAIINNEVKTGITAHVIDEGCDTGDILLQKEFAIGESDTGASILEQYKMAYPEMVETIIRKMERHQLNPIPQNNALATYFGKRTPEDGQIDWSWQKERIRNWVRAQAYPYPGAFTHYKGQKIIINKIEFTDAGFQGAMPDGLILSAEPLIVKTPNGAILIKEYQADISIETGQIFN